MTLNLPKNVEYIIDRLEKFGHKAYAVGGCVRDLLLGRVPSDFDITTSALPEETAAIFSDFPLGTSGIKHGTVAVTLDGEIYEVTTHRVDGEYRDSRRPESVSFTKEITADLSRRDFTVNAMAYNPSLGLVDPFFGAEDLERKIIRTVGDPQVRFTEDSLRIMRCVRFAASLGFDIEKKTSLALLEKSALLEKISGERIFIELTKLLESEHAYSVIHDYSDVLVKALPPLTEIRLPNESLFVSSDFVTRLLAIFALSHPSPATAFRTSCARLHTRADFRDEGSDLLDSLGEFDLDSDVGLNKLLREYPTGYLAIRLVKLEIILGADVDSLHRLLNICNSGAYCKSVSDLCVNGNDLASIGFRGREIGLALNDLLDAVIERRVKNSKDRLLAYASKMKEK